MKIVCHCPHCKELNGFQAARENPCAKCGKDLLPHPTDTFVKTGELNQCPVCGADHVYQQKDFNRNLGVGLLVIGIALSFFTYGISLLVVTVIDFLLYKLVGSCGVCYACQAVFRDETEIAKLKPFDLQLHDYYRSVSG